MDDDRFDLFEDDDTQPLDMSEVFRDDAQVEGVLDGIPSDEALFEILGEWRREVSAGLGDPAVETWREALQSNPSLVYVFASTGFPFEPRPTVRRALRDLVTAAVLFPVVRLLARIPFPHPKSW